MSSVSKIQLKTSSILNVPLQNYSEEFTFVVNGKEFKTTRLVSELISPEVCKIHFNDPTIDRFCIETVEEGDFSHILNLANFNEVEISAKETDFLTEVLEILGNESIEVLEGNFNPKITVDNILHLMKNHEKHSRINSKNFMEKVEFISTHFFEICEKLRRELKSLSVDTLYEILNHPKLQLNTEDQLVQFVNELCSENPTFSVLYETVHFVNVSSHMMKEFLSNYDEENMTRVTWKKLCDRLESEIEKKEQFYEERYKIEGKNGQTFKVTNENTFSGIFSYLKNNSSNKIDDIVNITVSSSNNEGYEQFYPINMLLYNKKNKFFATKSIENSWVCFDFKEHRVIPTDYTLRSYNYGQNSCHPKSWVIEGSNDNISWEILDEQTNCPYLNGCNLSHTFKIKNENSKEFKFIRMRSTGKNWAGDYYFTLESFEIYGTLI